MLSRICSSSLLRQNCLGTVLSTALKRSHKAGPISVLVNNPLVINKPCFATSSSVYKHKFIPYSTPPHEDHDYKNMRLKRPMSPHVTMYAPTEPAMTSIAQRAAGSILSAYAFLLGFGALVLPNGIESYVYMFQSMNMGIFSVLFLKIFLGFPFCFHYFNGIRFCIWNLGQMFALKEIKESARRVYIGAAVLTLFFAII